ncbi:unnamed protein product [Coffea canephora]|uniref:Uncharacterized protein n=1 Tax=Coffea canephora TaxID=49390 RepID=A0A068UZH0_COFCA|nr:unnamed protein product [Coffea canephora]
MEPFPETQQFRIPQRSNVGAAKVSQTQHADKDKGVYPVGPSCFPRNYESFVMPMFLNSRYELLGMQRNAQHRVDFLEWAPGLTTSLRIFACYCAIVGYFNGWSPTENCAREGHFGHDDYVQHGDDLSSNLPSTHVIETGMKEYDVFNIIDDPIWLEKFHSKSPPIANWLKTHKGRKLWLKKYMPGIPHRSKYRVYCNTPAGPLERVPAWAIYVVPDEDRKQAFAIHWELPSESKYKWKHENRPKPKSLRICECHVGISGQDAKVASCDTFIQKAILQVLPHVKESGYNAIQLIGLVEHKDYFYRVTNFYAVSSCYGTLEDLKRLVDLAHGNF